MIVSVSRRADVPAGQAEWFAAALERGALEVANPFRPSQRRRIDLSPAAVRAFVFWTRWPRPMLPLLAGLERRRVPFYVMVTLTGYPAVLEPRAPPVEAAVAAVAELADLVGRNRLVWRYDPVLLTAASDAAFQRRNFSLLAKRLAAHAFRVVVSLYDPYRKAAARLRRAGVAPWTEEETAVVLPGLLADFAAEATNRHLAIQSCAEDPAWAAWGIAPGKCVDDELLRDRFDLDVVYEKDPRQRAACRCQRSVDVGAYGSCRFGCLYCYAW